MTSGGRQHLVERIVERTLFSARWLLVPLYLGLGVLLIAFSVQLVRELIALAGHALWGSGRDVDLIVATLTLVDLTLVAGLVVMVMLSGYENFVSKLDIGEAQQSVAWLGKLDSGSLKVKVLIAIVTISAVQLLKAFMDIGDYADDKLLWMVVVHLTFVVSAFALAALDRFDNANH
ncbi:MAG TPA: TIGR00645 family protein [Stellaceae bacterium]|nr:TIGR00645 family protein [Stellaceae bacterium]